MAICILHKQLPKFAARNKNEMISYLGFMALKLYQVLLNIKLITRYDYGEDNFKSSLRSFVLVFSR